ncbi:hypothetical protein QFW77_01800 [Luteimonas sp. RD2P54]|uniref:Uncharacterized protein n=1 Tax=Luteimonas endophytica TaxID=3042023 RepID=A0ABT6J4J1_9GAMM|nr:hypothetical protein [Luteimonas endophytica]MDH5821729.1 hypothetical protein [Luteimonas endophytica]
MSELQAQLDALQNRLPGMIAQHPDPGEFWVAFIAEADPIVEQAGAHAELATRRIQAMLAEHDRYLVDTQLDDPDAG